MSAWTDDELGDLLRETFRDHEQPDDAEHAVRIARPAVHFVRRSRVLPAIAAVAAGIVVVGGVAAVVRYGGQRSGTSDASSASAAGGIAGPGAEVTGTPIGAQVRTMRAYGALPEGTPAPRPVTTVISDPSRLGALVRLVNGLRTTGASGRGPCPPTTLQPGYTTLVLRTTDGTWRFVDSDACTRVLQVDRDGRKVAPLASTGFLAGVAAVVH